jgi:hypothetical protein
MLFYHHLSKRGLRSAEKATGRAFTVGYYDVEDSIAEGRKKIDRVFPISGMFLLERSVLYDEDLDTSTPFPIRQRGRHTGLEQQLVEVIIKKAYHHLKPLGKPRCDCAS